MTKDPVELGDIAYRYAKEAVELDKRGLRSLATDKYQRAVEALAKLIEHYPDTYIRKIYVKKIREYRDRIQFLRGMIAEDAKDGVGFTIDRTQSDTETILTVKEKGVAQEPLKSYRVNINWDDIVDLEDVKKVIRQTIVYPCARPDLFPLGFPRGLLLYGPPGCGKTTVAAAVSNEINSYFFVVDAAMIMSKWLGEAEKNVASIFENMRGLASKETPAILFIDEVDSLIGVRQQEVGGEVRVRNQFLKEMDGIADKSGKHLPMYVIASTNKPWALDWAFIRRFQRRIYLPMPNRDVRSRLFQHFLRNVQTVNDIDYDALASLTENYTPSDIRDICQTANIEVVSELFESGRASNPNSRPRPIEMSDLRDSIRRIKPSVSAEIQRVYESWAERYRAF
ncbi:MAG: AAA family ATPase [Candidatus Geothermarchaeales archaeon]